MTDTDVIHLAMQTAMVAAKLAAPALITALVIGFAVSLFQSATQIQEFTLAFVPKLIGVAIALLVCGHWMLDTIVTFTTQLYQSIRVRWADSAIGRDQDAGSVELTLPAATLVALLLASARILAWTLVAPPIATAGVPATIKVVLSVGLGLAVLPIVKNQTPATEVSPVLGALVLQLVTGAGLGFVTRLLFSALESAGALIDVFGGFSLAAAYDPLSTTMTSIFGKFYGLLVTTLIFVTNIHLVIIGGFLRTFHAVPLDAGISLDRLGRAVVSSATEMFVAALQIAGPLIVVLFMADLALGVLNRIAPQLNAFSLSFPAKTGLTLLLVGFSFILMPETIAHLAGRVTTMVAGVTAG